MIVQIQQAQMAPIAAVEFLCLHQQHAVLTQRLGRELRDVGNALFLVDDQVVDGIQMFGTRLFDQIRQECCDSAHHNSCAHAGRRWRSGRIEPASAAARARSLSYCLLS